MKKSFLLLVAALIMSSSAFAIGGLDLSVGPKIGYQTAKLSVHKADIKSDFSEHFTVGAFVRLDFQGLYIQPEVLWFKSSNVFDMANTVDHGFNIGSLEVPTGANVNVTLKEQNIQVPIFIGYRFNVLSDILAIRPQVGPTLNFVIPQRTLVNTSVGTSPDVEIENQTFDTKTIAFGLQAGVGFDVLGFTLDINYNIGINKVFGANIINNTEWGQYIDTNNISDAHRNMFMVTLGYKFL